jgi:tagatose-1,6-bisphosphate aldolase
MNQIYLKVGKNKVNNKISFHFLNSQSLDCFKRDVPFIIELLTMEKAKQSKIYTLD